jgi:hypothetical protein
MKYPTVSEYIESLRVANDNLATLTSLELVLGTDGNPTYSKENHGVVFRMKDRDTDLEYNVKCFTDEQEGRETLYEQINNSQGVWIPDGVKYYANELFVDTAISDANEFPVVVIPCCKTTNLISFINTNIANCSLISKLADSFSCVVEWVKEKGCFWHELNVDSLYVNDTGHIVVSDIDGHIETTNSTKKNDDLNAYLILLSLKALYRDSSLFNAKDVKPYILFDGDNFTELPANEIITRLSILNDSEISSIISDVFVKIGHGNSNETRNDLQQSEIYEDGLKMMAEKGNVTMQLQLARKCWDNEMYEESFKWYKQAASQEDADGLYGLGLCYRNGFGIEKDLTKSFHCFLNASELGLLDAQYELAEAYYFGWGVRKDKTKAMDLYFKAAQRGHAMSEFMMGHYLMSNRGEIDSSFAITSKRDTVKAFEWFLKSAKQGYHPAQRRIGAFYETGTDPCVRNISKAMEWYQKAAAQGNDKALFAIGRLYANGLDERNPDNKKAYEYYLQAANKGLRDAQFRVGVALLFGKGIDKDKDAAVEWIRKSADKGYAAAKKLIIEIEYSEEVSEETGTTGLEIVSATIDDYGVLYSQDGKKLLKYSIEEGFDSAGIYGGSISMFDEESEFGSIKQQSLNQYKVKEGTEIICENAFYECESLQSITFPQSLKRIGDDAFYQCENLEYVGINEGLEEIGNNAFNGCVNLSSIVLPRSLKRSVAGSTFTGVQDIVSNSEKYICEDNCLYTSDFHTLIYFFQNGEDYLEIPYGVKTIGAYAFSESDIRHVDIPESVTEIGHCAFSHCMNLRHIYLPRSIIEIGTSAFYWCKKLIEVDFHEGLETIGLDAFFSCENLGDIKIPDTVREIQDGAFAFTGIDSITFPKNLKILGRDPFTSCPLSEIVSFSERFVVKDMAIYYDEGKTFINYYGKDTRFEIPVGVEKIADWALSNAYSLQEIVIPQTIKQIGCGFLLEASPKKIFVPSKIRDILIDKIPSYLADRVFMIEDDSN